MTTRTRPRPRRISRRRARALRFRAALAPYQVEGSRRDSTRPGR